MSASLEELAQRITELEAEIRSVVFRMDRSEESASVQSMVDEVSSTLPQDHDFGGGGLIPSKGRMGSFVVVPAGTPGSISVVEGCVFLNGAEAAYAGESMFFPAEIPVGQLLFGWIDLDVNAASWTFGVGEELPPKPPLHVIVPVFKLVGAGAGIDEAQSRVRNSGDLHVWAKIRYIIEDIRFGVTAPGLLEYARKKVLVFDDHTDEAEWVPITTAEQCPST